MEKLLTAGQVAELLGCSKQQVLIMAQRGDLPSWVVGERLVRFRPEAIEDYLEANRRGPKAL
jgi:excisionase family DNA binding protein